MKRYSRTSNLFDKTAEYVVGQNTYNYTISGLDPNKYYTCSTNFERISGVNSASLYFGGGRSDINGVWSDTPRTFKPNSSGEIVVYIRYTEAGGAPSIIDDVMGGTIWVMVNEGSTALPYEPYGNTWQTKSPLKYVNGGWVDSNPKERVNGDWVEPQPAQLSQLSAPLSMLSTNSIDVPENIENETTEQEE